MRAPGQVGGLVVFVLILVVLMSLSLRQLGIRQEEINRLAPSLIWVVNAFSAILALQSLAIIDEEDRGLLGLFLGGAPMGVVATAKWLTAVTVLLALQLAGVLFSALLLNFPLGVGFIALIEISILVSAAVSGVGVVVAAIAVGIRGREMILPILLFPLSFPIFAGAVFLSSEALQHGMLLRGSFWYTLLLSVIGVFGAVCIAGFERIIR